jgi:alginate O-acetyltransferase complex protein AlgI
MLFNSYAFIFAYLPIVLIITYGALRFGGTRAGTIALLIASLAFYAYWKIGVLPLLIGSIVFNYIVGRFLHRNRTAGRVDIARLFLIVGVAGDLALLAYYKYAMLLLGTVNDLTGIGVPVPSIVLPIGISFFTFTQIAFLVDVWKGKAQEYDAWRYGLFVSYFPHLIAGPILHHKDMIPQFNDALQFRITRENLAVGATIFVFGLAKKVLIADNVADAANLVFGRVIEGDHVSFAYAWLGAVSYSMQLYFDFSGYSDMAIGLSRMFGIALPLNFNSPYKSRNIVEFWRRWHMTLSQFLRDYLYIPLGGNRHGAARRYINLMLTMLLGGLWHGAA